MRPRVADRPQAAGSLGYRLSPDRLLGNTRFGLVDDVKAPWVRDSQQHDPGVPVRAMTLADP